MSYSIRWGGSPEDVTIAFAGTVPMEELLTAFAEISESPSYHHALRMIHDHRATDWSEVTSEDIRRRADAIVAYIPREAQHRVAIVVDRKLAYGLMRMREAHTEGRLRTRDRVFYDLESAREWLRQ